MYYLGVDCGGTKSLFILSDENGRLLASHRAGSGGFLHQGAEGLRQLVADGAAEVCRQANIGLSELTYAGLGFPGYGEKEGSEREVLEACRAALQTEHVVCDCDCALGWAGSLAMEPGINIVAGTGSICYGVNAKGESARSSGWGGPGDEGSCRWIGTRLVQLFTKQSDGRMPRTALYGAFRERFGITEDVAFIYTMNHDLMRNGAEVASLQRLALELSEGGDPCAAELYRDAARELASSIFAVARKLSMPFGYPASYSGGLFHSGKWILEPLAREVAQLGGALQAPRYTPDQGAVLMAMRAHQPERSFDGLTFTGA